MDITPQNPSEATLRERSERLAFLSDAASSLLSASDPDAFLDRIYERLAALLGLEIYLHYSLSRDGDALELRASRGLGDPQVEALRRLSLEQGVCGTAARTGKPRVVSEVQQTQGCETALLRSLGISAYACHPLIADGRLFGTLSFGTRRKKRFTHESIGLIRAVSDLVATAINRRQTEHALRESEELNRAFFEQAGIATAETGLDGRLLRVNARYCDLVGYSPEELYTMNFTDLTHPEDRPQNQRDFERLLCGEIPQFTATKRYVRKDGRVIWVQATGTLCRDAAGRPLRILGIVDDVTERRRADESLRASEARFRGLAEGMPHMVWETDAEGFNTYQSPLWHQYTGSDAQGSAGERWLQFYHPEDRARVTHEWGESRRTEGRAPYDVEARIRRHDGAFQWFRIKGEPIRDETGRVVKWVGTCTDIHARRQLEEERVRLLEAERAARAEAERASLMKDEFLATVSHELRTPLNAMLGWSQILMRGDRDPATLREGLVIIERNAKAQSRLIADLLDMSRILSGKLQLDARSVELRDIVERVVESVQPAARAKKVALALAPPSGAATVRGDPDRLQQVVWNLLSNAVKFTGRGGNVDVRVRPHEQQVELSVQDSGQGIARELLPHVFDRFRQGDPSASRRHGGLGLGLAIVRQLVEMHGGRIRAESAGPGLGARFTVYLPLALESAGRRAGREAPGTRRAAADLDGLTVLAVDDEPDSLSVVRRVLEDSRARVITATSAEEALRLVACERPDVLVSDIAMPGVDGYELIRRLRASQNGRALPAAALTAYVRPQDRARVLEAGYHAHLSKPVQEAELVATIRALVESASAAPRAPSPS